METATKEFKLPKEFAKKWLTALRSGKYLQAPFKLRTEHGYCCIGVAGDVCGIPHSIMESKGTFSFANGFIPENIMEYGFPKELIGAISTREKDTNSLVCALTRMNDGINLDGKGKAKFKTFSEIADWIETNVELY